MADPTFTMVTRSPTMVATIPINLTLTVSLAEDASNITASATARRRSQNRINQRAVRRRRAAKRAQHDQVFDLDAGPSSSHDTPTTLTRESSQQHQDEPMMLDDTKDPLLLPQSFPAQMPMPPQLVPHQPINAPLPLPPATLPLSLSSLSPTSNASWCRTMEAFLTTNHIANVTVDEIINTASGETATVSFEKSFLRNLDPADFFRMPADDHLLSLMYYNVFRALATNSRALGLDTYAMHADDYPSPFFPASESAYTTTHINADNPNVPPHLRPTILQQTVPHHPCFDIFPDPVVRDHSIRNTHLLPHGKLCMTLAGRNTWFENDRSRRNGLLIWGPPDDAESWEVTEGFVACFGWLVQGALLLQASTNRWRAVRGEPDFLFA